ncbi:MAG: hypothetical protein Ct9H300mP7_4870 [Verrucomicrobiota bacterium]|nr:MAG: hypothetical protein Ct9H300mP7_4870 [Verrucomicrobiota bacterium]
MVFPYKMCRASSGRWLRLGNGKLKPADVRDILKSCDRARAGVTAPPHGLILWKVHYRKGKAR